jgi:hypothetical protein
MERLGAAWDERLARLRDHLARDGQAGTVARA